MPSPASRSFSSDKSSPAQKWSPSPWITAAPASGGRFWNTSRSASIKPSFSALRLAGRHKRTTATAPCISNATPWAAARSSMGWLMGVMQGASKASAKWPRRLLLITNCAWLHALLCLVFTLILSGFVPVMDPRARATAATPPVGKLPSGLLWARPPRVRSAGPIRTA